MAQSHRELLLDAAKRCLRERGYMNTTARDLVAESGTNLGSIGYHFGSKEALLNEALAEVFAEWTERVTDQATGDATASILHRVAVSWVATLDSMPEHGDLLHAFVDSLGPTLRSEELRAQLAGHYRELRDQIAVAVEDSLGPGVADAQTIASFFMAVADGFVIQFLLDPEHCPSGEQLVAALGGALQAAVA